MTEQEFKNLQRENLEIDRAPKVTRGAVRSDSIIRFDESGVNHDDPALPRLPANSAAAAMQTILSQPAPIPDRRAETMLRRPETVKRERLEGDSAKSTPIDRAMAAIIRSIPICAVMIVVGIVMVMVTGLQGEVLIATMLGVLGTLIYYNAQEYRHSQAGVERLRSKDDHKLDMQHESNRHLSEMTYEQDRHDEQMAAIQGDISVKLRVLDIAAGYARLPDKQRGSE